MHILVVMISLLAFSEAASTPLQAIQEWIAYKLTYGKYYSSIEDLTRMNIFMKTKDTVEKNNKAYEKGDVSFKMQINQFSDMTEDEFNKWMTGFVRIPPPTMKTTAGSTTKKPVLTSQKDTKVPTAIDWRQKGAVTSVKNQGKCGACYTFSATGAIEGQNFKKTGKLVSLSEQNLKDCSTKYGNNGCNGGDMVAAFQYVKANGGIDTEDSYPYEIPQGTCRYDAKNIGAKVSGYVQIPKGDQNALKTAVGTVGPVSIALYASLPTFKQYASGVYYDPKCKNDIDSVNHGVLVVGYGAENNNTYWIVKNSWGSKWGEDGYIRISTKDDNCGVSTYASYPVV